MNYIIDPTGIPPASEVDRLRRELREAARGCDIAAKAIVDLENKLHFVLDRTHVEDGCYTFPDGDTWDAGSKAGGDVAAIVAAAEIWRHWWLLTHNQPFMAGDKAAERLLDLRDAAEIALEHEVANLTRQDAGNSSAIELKRD